MEETTQACSNDDLNEGGLMLSMLAVILGAIVVGVFDLSGLTAASIFVAAALCAWMYKLGASNNKRAFMHSSWKGLVTIAVFFVCLGLAMVAKSGLDMITAGSPCTTAEYPTCFPSVDEVKNNLFSGLYILMFSVPVAALGLFCFRTNIRSFIKNNTVK